ncbi:O-acetyl-ADP-ribose deacetylase [Microbaculum marinum]|uniref:O-acetyl-ADP-ribose deacetylase n=1 Tax=Microbaculum marinum TaxID=1764581 RepID=A0AAW9RKC7_9HYPH
MTSVEIVVADITTLKVDAIVNAANPALEPGGGVCGAIHRAAGPELAGACSAIGSCPTGEARITGGYRLPARHVIHAVGPVWRGGGEHEDAALESCYRASLALAQANGLRSVAFPAISTGIYGFPPDRAARIAVQAVRDAVAASPDAFDRVVLCCFDEISARRHEDAAEALSLPVSRR